jgi:hypothetical protein
VGKTENWGVLYFVLFIKIKENEMGGVYRAYGNENATKFWLEKPERKRSVGKPKHRWDNIKIYLRKVGLGVGLD